MTNFLSTIEYFFDKYRILKKKKIKKEKTLKDRGHTTQYISKKSSSVEILTLSNLKGIFKK